MLKELGEKHLELTIILTCEKARKVGIATKIMKPRSNVGVHRAHQEEVIFILNVHILKEMADPFHPWCFRNCPTTNFTMELMRVCSYLGYINFFLWAI